MEEYAVLVNYKKALDYREAQCIGGRYQIDAEEVEYWCWIYNEEIESDESF